MSDIDDDPIVEPAQPVELSHREKALRDLFVKEYLVDYDSVGAAVRVGYGQSYSREMAAKLMQCPYVANEIAKQELQSPEESAEVMRKRVIQGLIREANYKGPGASPGARVAALSKLAAIQGMDAPTRSKTEITGPDGQPLGGGVFVVPGIVTVEEWAAAAEKQQEELVNGTIQQVAQVPAST